MPCRNYYGFKVTELFGMSLYDAYTPLLQDFSTNHAAYGAMYNGNIMKDATCNDDLARMKANNEDFTWTVDWFKVDDGKYDLRKSFVKCNESTGKWESRVGSWSYCDIHSDHNHSKFVENTACYTTDALKYAQSSFFAGIVFF